PATLLGILRPEAVLLTPILSTEPSLPVVSRQPSKAQEHSAKRNGGDFFSSRVSPAFCFLNLSFALCACSLSRALTRHPPRLSGAVSKPEAQVNEKQKYKKNRSSATKEMEGGVQNRHSRWVCGSYCNDDRISAIRIK